MRRRHPIGRQRRPERRGGFTLIELLIVVAIVAMLAAVGIIQLLRVRITTNEQLALNSVRLIAKSSHFFFIQQQQYPSALADLGLPVSNPPFINSGSLLAGGESGYQFTYTSAASPLGFTVTANPQQPGVTGTQYFFVDESLVIHVAQGRPATAADPVIP